MKSKHLTLFIALFCIAGLSVPSSTVSAKEKTIKLVYTSSTIGYINGCGCNGIKRGGFARRWTVLDSIQAADPDVLLVDGGDTGDSVAKNRGWVTPFFWTVMQDMGYDLISVGRRDFSDSAKVYLQLSDLHEAKFLTGNIVHPDEKPLVKKYQIIEQNGVKIGFTLAISDNYSGFFRNANLQTDFESAKEALAAFEEENVDFKVLIQHARGTEAFQIADSLKGFDLLLVGNRDGKPMRARTTPENIPVVGPGDRGREIAVISLSKSGDDEEASVETTVLPISFTLEQSKKFLGYASQFRREYDKHYTAHRARMLKAKKGKELHGKPIESTDKDDDSE